MKRRLLSLSLVSVLLLGASSCQNNAITVNTYKAELQLAVNTFVTAMRISNPGWDSKDFSGHIANAIALWNVGADWQANAIAELVLAQDDVTSVSCNTVCQTEIAVILGAIATGITIAQTNHPQLAAKVSQRRVSQYRGRTVKVYGTWKQYKADWNTIAPAGAKL